jgi:hypothetical protein
METKVKNSSNVNGTVNNKAEINSIGNIKTAGIESKNLPENKEIGKAGSTDKNKAQFVAGNPVNEVSAGAKASETIDKTEDLNPGQVATPAPEAEPTKKELKADVKTKPVLNLEGTLKLVEELHRRTIQRNKLLSTINTLEAFEIELKEDADETDTNYFTGSTLTIEDDKRNKFVTKNPVIIWTVAQMVNSLCVDKLAEIEAGIIIPA